MQTFVVEAMASHDPRSEILRENVCLQDQFACYFPALELLKVNRDAALGTIGANKETALAIEAMRREAASIVAFSRLFYL